VQEGEHRDLMIAAITTEGEAHSALLGGEFEAARAGYARAVEQYRASWELAPPKSYGRLVGLVKAAVLGGTAPAAAQYVRATLEDDADATSSPVAAYARAVASLIVGDDEAVAPLADVMVPRGGAFERTATALRALAGGDRDAYAAVVCEIEADFAARDEHLTGVAIADTAIMLELIAADRGLEAGVDSPLVPVP